MAVAESGRDGLGVADAEDEEDEGRAGGGKGEEAAIAFLSCSSDWCGPAPGQALWGQGPGGRTTPFGGSGIEQGQRFKHPPGGPRSGRRRRVESGGSDGGQCPIATTTATVVTTATATVV